jgi:hypothetical protein
MMENSDSGVERTKKTMRVRNGLIYKVGMILLCLFLYVPAHAQEYAKPQEHTKPNEVLVKPNEVLCRIGNIEDDLSLRTVSGTPKTIYLHGVRYRKSGVGQRLARVFLSERILGKDVRMQIRGMARPGVCYADVIPEGTREQNSKGAPLSLNEEIIQRGIANWENNYVAARADLAVCEDEARKSHQGFWGDASGKGMTKESMTAPLTFSFPVSTPQPLASPAPVSIPISVPVSSPLPVPTPLANAPVPIETPAINWLPWVLSGMLAMTLALQLVKRLPWRQWLVKKRQPKPKEYAIGTIVPLCEAYVGPITVQGVVQVANDTLQTPTGNHPCVYYHETVEIYQRVGDSPLEKSEKDTRKKSRYEWVCIRDEQDVCAFRIEDGSGEANVAAERAEIHATQVLYLYNDVPVGQFFENPYPDDKRTKIALLSPGALVTIQGRYEGGALVSTAKGLFIREQDHLKNA